MNIQVRFTEHDWERIERDWTAWWQGDLKRPLVVIEGWDSPTGLPPLSSRQFVTHFPNDTPVDDLLDHYQKQLEAKRHFGDAWPKWWPNFGPGIGAALRIVHEITELWFQYYDDLYDVIKQAGRGTTPWAPIWSPKRTYMLQSDFSFIISPQMFERFVMPDLVASCDRLDHAFYHLDGKGELPHLDMLLSIDRLRGIQWIPGAGQPPPEQWLSLLHRIRDGGKLCQLYVTPEGARTIVREIGGHGFAFHIEGYMSAKDAEAFLKVLANEDIGETNNRPPDHSRAL